MIRPGGEPAFGPDRLPHIPGFGELTIVGHGGMGVVYRATELALGRPVALKLLPAARLASPSALLRAEREAQVLARIDHPGVVRVFSTGSAAGMPWIAMEWIDGPTLGRRIGTSPLPHREAARIARDLALALEKVHAAGIVHRDIKPDNILLAGPATAGAPSVAKLVDFGLARPDDPDGGLTMAAAPLGTPSFMAPEQTGRDPALGLVGPATDIHGLGATLYCMLTGRAPYHGVTTSESLARAAQGDAPALTLAAPGVPLDLRTIVEACLRRRPEQRYPSAAALADDLTRFLDGRPIRARAVGRAERCLKWARRRPALAAALGALVLAALGAVGGTVYHLRQLRAAYAAVTESRDAALAAGELARRSFERLTDDSAERLLLRGQALDAGDRDHLLRVRTEYRDWPLEPDVAAGLRFRIAGLRRVAMLFQRLSRPEEMLATLDMTLGAIDDMERRGLLGAAEERLRHELLRGRRSDLLQRGLVDEAVAMTRAEIDRLGGRVGAVPSLCPHLASAHGDLAAILDGQGKSDEAADHFRRALDHFDRLTAGSAVADVPVHLELSVRFNATISHMLGGDPASRAALATRLVARAEAILATDPADASDRQAASRALLMGLRLLADGALAGGDPTAALSHLRRLSETARALAAANPQDHSFTDEVVMAARQGLECHERLGKPAAAAEDLAVAIEMASRAVADEPASLPRARTLATAVKTEADMLRTTGDMESTLSNCQRIVEVMAPWLAAEGGGDEARRIAVAALVDAGKAALALQRRAAAIAALEQAVPLAPPDTRPAIEAEIAVLRLADRPDAVAGP